MDGLEVSGQVRGVRGGQWSQSHRLSLAFAFALRGEVGNRGRM